MPLPNWTKSACRRRKKAAIVPSPSGTSGIAGASIAAVVSRGGRPDLADERLRSVQAPTLLIVGSEDSEVLGLNRWAQESMRCPTRLAVVEGATHLFEEPGTLAEAAALARDWFLRHLSPAGEHGDGTSR